MEWHTIDLQWITWNYCRSQLPPCISCDLHPLIWEYTDWVNLKSISYSAIGIRHSHEEVRWYLEYTVTSGKKIQTNPEECTFYHWDESWNRFASHKLWQHISFQRGPTQRLIHTELFSQSSLGAFAAVLRKYVEPDYRKTDVLVSLSVHIDAFAYLILHESCWSYRHKQIGDIPAETRNVMFPQWYHAADFRNEEEWMK